MIASYLIFCIILDLFKFYMWCLISYAFVYCLKYIFYVFFCAKLIYSGVSVLISHLFPVSFLFRSGDKHRYVAIRLV